MSEVVKNLPKLIEFLKGIQQGLSFTDRVVVTNLKNSSGDKTRYYLLLLDGDQVKIEDNTPVSKHEFLLDFDDELLFYDNQLVSDNSMVRTFIERVNSISKDLAQQKATMFVEQ